MLNRERLLLLSNNLFDQLSLIRNSKSVNQNFFTACEVLATSLRSYADYLDQSQQRVDVNRKTVSDLIPDSFYTPREPVPIATMKNVYKPVNDLLKDKELYEPVHLIGDFIPTDRKKRYNYFDQLQISHRY